MLCADVLHEIFSYVAYAAQPRMWRAVRLVSHQWNVVGATLFDPCLLCAQPDQCHTWIMCRLRQHDCERLFALIQATQSRIAPRYRLANLQHVYAFVGYHHSRALRRLVRLGACNVTCLVDTQYWTRFRYRRYIVAAAYTECMPAARIEHTLLFCMLDEIENQLYCRAIAVADATFVQVFALLRSHRAANWRADACAVPLECILAYWYAMRCTRELLRVDALWRHLRADTALLTRVATYADCALLCAAACGAVPKLYDEIYALAHGALTERTRRVLADALRQRLDRFDNVHPQAREWWRARLALVCAPVSTSWLLA